MTSETRGQNSWVNFGPHAEHNRYADGDNTIYADQKVMLMPMWASQEGRINDTPVADTDGRDDTVSTITEEQAALKFLILTSSAPRWLVPSAVVQANVTG